MGTNQNKITLIAALILISCAFAFGTDMVVNNGYDPGAMRTDGTNADSPVFPGAVTVTGKLTAADGAEFNGTASAVKILGAGATPNTTNGKGGLDIWNSYLQFGADLGFTTRTASTVKYSYLLSPTYVNGLSTAMLVLTAGEPSQILDVGGGSGAFYSAQTIRFWTSTSRATIVSTNPPMTLTNAGQLLIATTAAAIDSAVKLKLNGGMEISPGGFAVIGSGTRMAGYDLTVASGAYLANVVATGTLTIPLVAPADPQPGMIWFEP